MNLDSLLADCIATNPAIRSPETKRLLALSCRHFAHFLQRPALAADLTDKQIVAYMQHRQRLGRSEKTVEREAAKILTLARYAALCGQADVVRLRLVKSPVDVPTALTRPQLWSLWRAARRYQAAIGGIPGNVYSLALLDTLWWTGERLGAVWQLERADIDVRSRWITFRHRKARGRVQLRRVPRSAARSLGKLLAVSPGERPFAVFGAQTSLYHHLNRLLLQAGIPVDRRHKFHCLRRSHASWLHQRGGNASESLGHSDSRITTEYYLDPKIVVPAQPADSLFSPGGWWGYLAGILG